MSVLVLHPLPPQLSSLAFLLHHFPSIEHTFVFLSLPPCVPWRGEVDFCSPDPGWAPAYSTQQSAVKGLFWGSYDQSLQSLVALISFLSEHSLPPHWGMPVPSGKTLEEAETAQVTAPAELSPAAAITTSHGTEALHIPACLSHRPLLFTNNSHTQTGITWVQSVHSLVRSNMHTFFKTLSSG